MAGLDPAIQTCKFRDWMPGSSPGMTPGAKSQIGDAELMPLSRTTFWNVCREADVSAIRFVRFCLAILQKRFT